MKLPGFLSKLLRRTERDIAIAGVMVGSVTAMGKLFPQIEHFTTLRVNFYNGQWSSWDCIKDDGAKPKNAFRDFLKWYHGRPQSDCFVMQTKVGANMVRRKDIFTYDITHGKRTRKAS